MQNLRRDPRGGRQRPRQARQDDRLPAEPRRLRGDERGLRAPRRRQPAGAVDGRGREAPLRRARRDRGDRPPSESRIRTRACRRTRSPTTCTRSASTPTSSAARSATSCSGSRVQGADFVVPGVGHAELRAALEPHGRVEDLVVADQRVGVRLLPRDRTLARSRRPGSSSRRRASSARPGPGRHDFEIVADAGDLARAGHGAARLHDQRDRAAARDRRAARSARRPRPTSSAGVLRTTSPTSFADDPLRIVRGLRFVSQLDLDPDEDTLRQMREWAPQIEHVSGERIGGGLAADGMGELSKLLLGAQPGEGAAARPRHRRARRTCCRSSSRRSASTRRADYHDLPLDEHTFAVVQAAADAGVPLRVRLAALLHDLGKPRGRAATGGDSRKPIGAPQIAAIAALIDGCAIPTRLPALRRPIVREHMFELTASPTPVDARRFLARHGDEARARPGRAQARPISRARRVPDERRGSSRLDALPDARRAGARAARTGSPTSPSTATT